MGQTIAEVKLGSEAVTCSPGLPAFLIFLSTQNTL